MRESSARIAWAEKADNSPQFSATPHLLSKTYEMSSSRDPVTCLAQIKCPLSGRELEKAEVSSIRVDMNRPAYWPANFILGYSKELFPAFFIDPFHQYTGTLFQVLSLWFCCFSRWLQNVIG